MGNTGIKRNVHQGRNLKRLREASGIKQESMALDMKMSQQNVSRYESSHEIDDEILARFAAVLGVPTEVIKEMEEDVASVIIENNTFNEGSIGNNGVQNNNPVDKLAELYERMLKTEQERNAALLQEIAVLKQKYGEK